MAQFSLQRMLVITALTLSTGLILDVGTGASAAAQSKQEIEQAKKRFREGKKLYQSEEYDQAAEAFKEAYELSGRSELLYNVGQSYRLGGNLREAEKYLQQYLAEAPDARNADDVVELIVEVQQQIAAELATVQVETEMAGRGVYVDDEPEPRCQTPCSVTVPPGPRRITLKGDGAQDTVEEITLEPGKTFQLKTRLADAVVSGRLMLSTDRSGIVEVGDTRLGLPLRQPIELPVGEYPVTVESARRARWTGKVSIEPEKTTEVFVPMQSLVEARKRGSLRKSLAYGLWGVSAAAAVGGVLMGLQTRSTYDALVGQRDHRGFVDEDLRAQGQRQQTVSNLMFGIAGGAVVTGIALFVWDEFAAERDPEAPPARPTEEVAER